jgi:hypothetical protein
MGRFGRISWPWSGLTLPLTSRLNTLTPLVPVTMTDVTVQQPVDIGSSGAVGGLTVTAS